MGKIEWAMWANEHALVSSIMLVLGGFLATAGRFNWWQFGIAAIIFGILIFIFEYPRGKRQKDASSGKRQKDTTTPQRRYQRYFTSLVKKGGLMSRNYFWRFVVYLGCSVPCLFILQTMPGAACLIMSSFIYFAAAVKGEEWVPLEDTEDNPVIQEPRAPPPRRPDTVATITTTTTNQDFHQI